MIIALLEHIGRSGGVAQLIDARHCDVASDILHGADAIAEFLYGDRKYRRKVYRLIQAKRLPHFRLGKGLCARRTALTRWIDQQEGTSKHH
jgi:excisionase family DNA binding protein